MLLDFGLYIHWPFCVSKCPYCDFNSHVRESIDEKRWVSGLLKELDHLSSKGHLKTIFFGGGTPSLMPPEGVKDLIEAASKKWNPPQEITLEANPNTFDRERFQDFHQAGINRLSLGIQSLREEGLTFLGRSHSLSQARHAIEAAQTIFPRFSFDLIYARKDQTLASWKEELKEALDLARGHLSLYQLTIEPGTSFHRQTERGKTFTVPDDEAALFYEETGSLMKSHGYDAYEVSNYAQKGQECLHNLIYWQYKDYLCLGPGAHGRITDSEGTKHALKNYRTPETWLKKVEELGSGREEDLRLSQKEMIEEYLLMGLRLAEGLSKEDFESRFNCSFDKLFKEPLKTLEPLLYSTPEQISVTPQGRLVLSAILEKFML